jgi:hypothetical protein
MQPDKAINSFLKFRPDESWITANSGLSWLKLDIEIPCESISKEAAKLYPESVLHRPNDSLGLYKNTGWRGLTLYGQGPFVTEDTGQSKSWTSVADQCPVTVKFIKQYWNIDEQTGRIRFMWLDPGGYILPHSDRKVGGLYETNIAIDHPAGNTFRFLDHGTVPFHAGSAFMLDISRRHLFVNQSQQVRCHIIVHSMPHSGVVKKSYDQSFYS